MEKNFFSHHYKQCSLVGQKSEFIKILKQENYNSLSASPHCMIHVKNIYALAFEENYEKCHKYINHSQFLELLKETQDNIFNNL